MSNSQFFIRNSKFEILHRQTFSAWYFPNKTRQADEDRDEDCQPDDVAEEPREALHGSTLNEEFRMSNVECRIRNSSFEIRNSKFSIVRLSPPGTSRTRHGRPMRIATKIASQMMSRRNQGRRFTAAP